MWPGCFIVDESSQDGVQCTVRNEDLEIIYHFEVPFITEQFFAFGEQTMIIERTGGGSYLYDARTNELKYLFNHSFAGIACMNDTILIIWAHDALIVHDTATNTRIIDDSTTSRIPLVLDNDRFAMYNRNQSTVKIWSLSHRKQVEEFSAPRNIIELFYIRDSIFLMIDSITTTVFDKDTNEKLLCVERSTEVLVTDGLVVLFQPLRTVVYDSIAWRKTLELERGALPNVWNEHIIAFCNSNELRFVDIEFPNKQWTVRLPIKGELAHIITCSEDKCIVGVDSEETERLVEFVYDRRGNVFKRLGIHYMTPLRHKRVKQTPKVWSKIVDKFQDMSTLR